MKKLVSLLIILIGIVLGSYLGEISANVSWLSFMAYGKEFGLTEPVVLNLSFIEITFGLWCKLNIASIVGLVLGIFVAKKVS